MILVRTRSLAKLTRSTFLVYQDGGVLREKPYIFLLVCWILPSWNIPVIFIISDTKEIYVFTKSFWWVSKVLDGNLMTLIELFLSLVEHDRSTKDQSNQEMEKTNQTRDMRRFPRFRVSAGGASTISLPEPIQPRSSACISLRANDDFNVSNCSLR